MCTVMHIFMQVNLLSSGIKIVISSLYGPVPTWVEAAMRLEYTVYGLTVRFDVSASEYNWMVVPVSSWVTRMK